MVAQVEEVDVVKSMAEAEIKEDAIWAEVKNWLESLTLEDLETLLERLEEKDNARSGEEV